MKLWQPIVEGKVLSGVINVYPKNDPDSSGFTIKICSLYFRARYSKKLKQWFVSFYWCRKNLTRAWELKIL